MAPPPYQMPPPGSMPGGFPPTMAPPSMGGYGSAPPPYGAYPPGCVVMPKRVLDVPFWQVLTSTPASDHILYSPFASLGCRTEVPIILSLPHPRLPTATLLTPPLPPQRPFPLRNNLPRRPPPHPINHNNNNNNSRRRPP